VEAEAVIELRDGSRAVGARYRVEARGSSAHVALADHSSQAKTAVAAVGLLPAK
jgi:hypothetical protein